MGSVGEDIATAYVEMDDSIENESIDTNKRFRTLLKKYQSLSVEYYNQDLETKRTFALLIQRNQELMDELKRIQYENKVLKNRISTMMMGNNCNNYSQGDIRCMGALTRKHMCQDHSQQEVKW